MDFMRGASLAPEGRAIIALPVHHRRREGLAHHLGAVRRRGRDRHPLERAHRRDRVRCGRAVRPGLPRARQAADRDRPPGLPRRADVVRQEVPRGSRQAARTGRRGRLGRRDRRRFPAICQWGWHEARSSSFLTAVSGPEVVVPSVTSATTGELRARSWPPRPRYSLFCLPGWNVAGYWSPDPLRGIGPLPTPLARHPTPSRSCHSFGARRTGCSRAHAENWAVASGLGTVEEYRKKSRILAEHCAAVGRDPDDIGDPARVRDALLAYADAGVTHFVLAAVGTPGSPVRWLADELIEPLLEQSSAGRQRTMRGRADLAGHRWPSNSCEAENAGCRRPAARPARKGYSGRIGPADPARPPTPDLRYRATRARLPQPDVSHQRREPFFD